MAGSLQKCGGNDAELAIKTEQEGQGGQRVLADHVLAGHA